MQSDFGDRIEIDVSDLPVHEEQNKIVIDISDLPPDHHTDYPGFVEGKEEVNYRPAVGFASLSGAVFPLFLSGFIGGLLAWGITEYFFDDSFRYYDKYYHLLIEIGIFTAIIGGSIGALLGSVEGITSRVKEKVFKGFLVASVFGLFGGAVGGVIAQLMYTFMGGGSLNNFVLQVLVRAFAWSIVGLFVGIGQGLGTGGGKRIANGLLGGLFGGFIGGLLFDIVGNAAYTGTLSRAIAIPLIGVCTGIGIGLVQEVRKDAWLKAISGVTAGKEYIIFGQITTIGSHYNCDVVLIKDLGVAEKHAEILIDGNHYYIRPLLEGGPTVAVGNRIIRNHRLVSGEIIRLGDTELQYYEKPAKQR